jgi:excisionase family DNA binding protein
MPHATSNEENRVNEAAKLLTLSRKTIARRIADGSLASTKRLGTRLITAESMRGCLSSESDQSCGKVIA